MSLDGIKSIEDFEITDKKVFIRLDLNVPIKNGEITDDKRIRESLPTIQYALSKEANIVLASHLGRPQTQEDRKKLSLEPVARRLNELLNVEVILIDEPRSEAPKALLPGLKRNQLLLLENLRFDEGEVENDKDLVDAMAVYTDVYINDAFGSSHRAHASIVGLPSVIKKKGLGFLMKKEIEMLDKVTVGYKNPYVAIMGGAKVSDKIGMIENLIDKVDQFIIGGAMAYTFLAAQGVAVGKSLVEKDKVKFAKDLLERVDARGKKILLPVDHLIAQDINADKNVKITPDAIIENDWLGVDIGPKTVQLFSQCIAQAKTIFWNGPMGVFETKAFSTGTFKIAEALAQNSSAITIVGGGDSASAAQKSGFADKMSHISTGGGASLEYLQGDHLPGIEVLRHRRPQS